MKIYGKKTNDYIFTIWVFKNNCLFKNFSFKNHGSLSIGRGEEGGLGYGWIGKNNLNLYTNQLPN